MTSPPKAKSTPKRGTDSKNGTPASSNRKGGARKKDKSESASEAELDSDHLDSDEDDEQPASKKRKRTAATKASAKSPKKRKATAEDDEFEDDDDDDLPGVQKIVGKVIEAPKTGRVPPGQISQNTLSFLSDLRKPECNDRQWFRLHEPVYRLAEKEFKDFVEEFTSDLVRVDAQIPHLPPKDVIHRIYRDIRFSNDKTPYKAAFSVSFSRSGRKGKFAGYHVAIKPGGSLIAAGLWCPEKDSLATIRHHLTRNPQQFRDLISAPDFVQFFGEATPHPKKERQNVFGAEDELKTAPKGFGKDHKDIDLLRLRSFAVFHRLLDSEVLAPNFRETLSHVIEVVRPFVHKLNDMVSLPPDEDDDEEGDE